ncbi:MAG: phosphate/phosphite/phosphonate ABC transporter substrate-binding protein [Deltaproteobacteria bacterium]|nr:phosphate/phosphite/phosphonate ABC transporter substrate-binding protein [Deltaproteobacteria bacterium]
MRCLAQFACLWGAWACGDGGDRGLLGNGRAYPDDPPGGHDVRLVAADLPEGVTRLRLGVTPYTTRERAASDLAVVIAYMQERLGMPVDLVAASSYQELVGITQRREVELALLAPTSYVEAKSLDPDLQLVARTLTHGAPEYASYLVVRVDDPARAVADLRGRRVAWVDPLSASGFLYPRQALNEMGLNPEKFFGSQTFYGTHEDAVTAVIDGRADVAAVASGIFERIGRVGGGDVDRGSLRVLHKAGRIPYDALVVRADIRPSGARKIGWAFVGLSTRTPQGRRILRPTWSITGWIPAEDSVYDSARATLHQAATAPAAATATGARNGR